jgi:hypothetical protein
MRLLPLLLFLAAIALGIQTSPATHPEKPVVKNGDRKLKEQKAENHATGKDSPAVASGTDKDNPTSQTKEKNSQPNPDDRVYSVNVVSQPESRRDPWFVAYVVFTGVSVLVGLSTLGLLYRQTSATKIAAYAAKKSADIAEMAVKLSERADVLLQGAVLETGQAVSGGDSRVVVRFKNFGHTRASNVALSLNILIEGVPDSDSGRIPPITMGAGDEQTVSSGRFTEFLTFETARNVLSGKLPLHFETQALYQDVFGAAHRTFCAGRFEPRTGGFEITRQETN